MVEFWREEDARNAESAMHCAEVEGQNIAVQVYQSRRASGNFEAFSANAPPFVPSGQVFPYPTQVRDLSMGAFIPVNSSQYSPPRTTPYPVRSPIQPVPFVHGPGQQVQLAPMVGPGSNSHSGLIDPCNLFCKVR